MEIRPLWLAALIRAIAAIFRQPPRSLEIPVPPPAAVKPEAAHLAIERMIDEVISREGGYVNHPNDRGGPTNCGITRDTLASWRRTPVTAHDVRAMSMSEAAEIYRARYFFQPGINRLPPAIQPQVFDIAVNSGPKRAIILLQRALNTLGARVAEDGQIGPATAMAARDYSPRKINEALCDARICFYSNICQSDPSQRVFLNGWIKRANTFRT